MTTTTRSEIRTARAACAILAGCMLIGLAGPSIPNAGALPFTLADGNSYINIETNNQATVYDWFVEEPVSLVYIDHLQELSNWYRVDDPFGVPISPETSVSTLTKVSQVASNTNADPRPDTLNVLYQDFANEFRMRIIYNIAGGAPGSGFSQLDEDIEISNLSFTEDLDIYVFEYVDLDLHNTPGDDTLRLTGPGGLHQSDRFTDAVGTFEVDRHEIDEIGFPPPDTLDKLMDGNVDDLNDVWPGGAGPIGPGNVTWALQWNFVGPGPGSPPGFRQRIPRRTATVIHSAFIHKEGYLQMHYVIPEPASGFLAALGGTALLHLRRRRMS